MRAFFHALVEQLPTLDFEEQRPGSDHLATTMVSLLLQFTEQHPLTGFSDEELQQRRTRVTGDITDCTMAGSELKETLRRESTHMRRQLQASLLHDVLVASSALVDALDEVALVEAAHAAYAGLAKRVSVLSAVLAALASVDAGMDVRCLTELHGTAAKLVDRVLNHLRGAAVPRAVCDSLKLRAFEALQHALTLMHDKGMDYIEVRSQLHRFATDEIDAQRTRLLMDRDSDSGRCCKCRTVLYCLKVHSKG